MVETRFSLLIPQEIIPCYQFILLFCSPIRRRCNYCNVEVVTYVEHEGHPMFLLIAILVMMIFGLLSLVILPVGYLVTKSAVHRCSRCLQKMGEKRCFGIPTNFSDEVSPSNLINCLDLAIPPGEVSCRDITRVCHDSLGNFLTIQPLLCLHVSKHLYSAYSLPGAQGIQANLSHMGRIFARLRWRGHRRE